MGRLFEFIFFAVVAYFVFRFLNRLFSSSPVNNKKTSQQQYRSNPEGNSNKDDLKWDAETVDYEEIETQDNEKK